MVKLRSGKIMTIQQALCSIKDDRGKQLFVGVEQIKETKSVIYIYDWKNQINARGTIGSIHQVLRELIKVDHHNKIKNMEDKQDVNTELKE